MEIDFSLLQLAIFGGFSGFGATLGMESAKFLLSLIKKHVAKNINGNSDDKGEIKNVSS